MNRRRYVRHPIRVPVVVRYGGIDLRTRSGDISEGGLSFEAAAELLHGTQVEVELPVHHTRFKLTGTVASCVPMGESFRVGLSFVETGLQFKMKLAEQVLRIEELRQTLSLERGREVTNSEAAAIWVEKYASTFADLYPH
jgi:hypothetical protein